ncbi:MFS transporter [Micromonospora sp. HUAS YX12]|uniref:MFS transporter n=1 Tax=Micromonospora sp. HUAS YX12 TaxID=3156396 RepID=A0AAU7QVA3_9ACTN
MPLTGYLVAHLGWRDALLTLAAIHGTVTIPLHALTVRTPPHVTASAPAARPGHTLRRVAARAAMRDARFWVLAAALIVHGAATSTIGVHLVGYLTSRGHPATFAATAAGLLGVLSVTGRLVLTGARRRLPVTTIVAAVFAIQAAAVSAMPLAAGTRVGAVVAVTGFGLGFGIASLATPALLADRYRNVGQCSGLLAGGEGPRWEAR